MGKKFRKSLKILMISLLAVLIILCGGFYIYTLDYYRADNTAHEVMDKSSNIETTGNLTVFRADATTSKNVGLIFYPGGKVEAIAYAPFLKALSDKGVTCVLVKMPFNLAVFNINAADSIIKKFPEVTKWYLGGHSLGGAMASSYVNKNSSKLQGLILLGAYPINDSTIPTIAIYGSEDIMLDKSKLTTVKNKLELVGGNHAHIGNYGEQKGDGTASMPREEQQAKTVDAILEFISIHTPSPTPTQTTTPNPTPTESPTPTSNPTNTTKPTLIPTRKPTSTPGPGAINIAGLSNVKKGWWYTPGGSSGVPSTILSSDSTLIKKHGGIWQGDTTKKKIYITMDVGYEYNNNTTKILDIAKGKNFKICFFVTGTLLTDANLKKLVTRMANEGHLVGNHSFTHPSFPVLLSKSGVDAVVDEMRKVENSYYSLTGKKIASYMRPPMGEYSEATTYIMQKLGYKSVFWSFAYRDWETANQPSESDALKKITDNLHNGSILLLHTVSNTNVAILPELIDAIRAKGYTISLISEL
jgi:delta-lactam-biosynthetic de-N-acetylase